jgi:hypothetical protein
LLISSTPSPLPQFRRVSSEADIGNQLGLQFFEIPVD